MPASSSRPLRLSSPPSSTAPPAASTAPRSRPPSTASTARPPASPHPDSAPSPSTAPSPSAATAEIAGAVLVSQSTYRILQDLYAERLGLFKVVLLSVAVAGILSFVVAATIARPLRHLRDEAEAILDHRGRLTGGFQGSRRADQIGDLARALQELTRRLDARMKTLESFAADVSHELRNPLTSIRTAAEMAAEVDDPAERGRFRDIVQRDIARVERLLAGVRDIASIDARLDQEEKENVRLDGFSKRSSTASTSASAAGCASASRP